MAGGAPQKYVTGSLAEGEIAALSILDYLKEHTGSEVSEESIKSHENEIQHFFGNSHSLYSTEQIEEAMQTVMDSYAGGIGTNYRFSENSLEIAERRIDQLEKLSYDLYAENMQELMYIYELRERLVVCRMVIEHLKARKETRWHCFAENSDYPECDDMNWNVFVNSRFENGKIEIILRSVKSQ